MKIVTRTLVLLLMVIVAGCAVQTRPVLTPFADGEFWVVTQPLSYPIPESDAVIVVPQGFVTDFASVPRIFWTVFPRHGEYTTAAIVHDFLYWEQKCTREQADNLFDLVMQDADVSMASRLAIYAAVRLGGGSAWEENAELKEEGEVRIIPSELMDFGVKTKWLDFRDVLKAHRKSKDDEWVVSVDDSIPLYCTSLDKDDESDAEAVSQPGAEEPESEQPDSEPGEGKEPGVLEVNHESDEPVSAGSILDD